MLTTPWGGTLLDARHEINCVGVDFVNTVAMIFQYVSATSWKPLYRKTVTYSRLVNLFIQLEEQFISVFLPKFFWSASLYFVRR